MDIQLKVIDQSNYQECIDLCVSEDQKDYVAPNILSLVQCAYEPDFHPLAIYRGDVLVGFILYDFDLDINGWSMSRFMIGADFQGKGYGRESLSKFLAYFNGRYGNVRLYTSAALDNAIAIGLYEFFGFKRLHNFDYEVKGKLYQETRMMLEVTK